MKSSGVISRWNDAKGFGFIKPDEGGEELFLHISVFRGERRPQSPLRWVVALAYPVASLLTYLFYWLDKRSALRGEWRTPEAQLHLFELMGGWPGALIAQQAFRHKTRKVSFQVVFWIIVVAHLAFWTMVNYTLLTRR